MITHGQTDKQTDTDTYIQTYTQSSLMEWLHHSKTTDYSLMSFHDFGHFWKSFKNTKNTCYSMCSLTMSYSRLFFHDFHHFLKFFKIEKNDRL